MGLLTLRAMARGDRRAPTDPELPRAASALSRWPHDDGSLRLFRYSGNFLYTFTNQGQRQFLRVAPDEQRSRVQIAAELDLLAWLHAAGFTVATPIPSRAGNLIESVATEPETYHAVVFAELTGEQRETGTLGERDLTAWGAALGQLHAALRRYPHAAAADRPSWRDDLAVAKESLLPRHPTFRTEYDELAPALAALPRGPDVFGLIHFDFELDNIVWQNGSLGMLDFDDCSHHWYAADIAFALRDLFDAGVSVGDRRVQAFLDGYADYAGIDDTMIELLPLFSRLARLTQAGRVARALDLDPNSDYPAWLRELEARLVRMLAIPP